MTPVFNIQNPTPETCNNFLAYCMRATSRTQKVDMLSDYLPHLSMRTIRRIVDGQRVASFFVAPDGILHLEIKRPFE